MIHNKSFYPSFRLYSLNLQSINYNAPKNKKHIDRINKMIKEFERVVLTEDLKDTSFIKGDVGTVVMIYPGEKGYEIEFFALNGSTLGVESVLKNQIIPATTVKQVLHVQV
jgi:uncharacterized protein DUF4926